MNENGQSRQEIVQESKPIAGRYFTTQDTIAQWAMAVLALAATGVSIWAVWLVRETLVEAGKTTKAAIASNEIQRRANRPWLTLRRTVPCDFEVEALPPGSAREHGYEYKAKLDWRYALENVGASPAFGYWQRSKIISYHFISEAIRQQDTLIKECALQFRRNKSNVIFPNDDIEITDNMVASLVKKESSDANEFCLITVLIYTDQERELTGIESRILAIDPPRDGDGYETGTHRLFEYARERITK